MSGPAQWTRKVADDYMPVTIVADGAALTLQCASLCPGPVERAGVQLKHGELV